jgi:dTDP-4-dehydrorhamnose 3,5-epimerase
MDFKETKIKGVFIIEGQGFKDARGSFVKTFNKDLFKSKKLNVTFRESFYSFSKKNVIRGMHFHLPPKDHSKFIYVPTGAILDVVVDLRKSSPTYGKFVSEELSAENRKMIFIPTGCAHGFLSLKNDTCTMYLQSSTYSKEHDTGIHFNSFGFSWPVKSPILSERDQNLTPLKNFDSPFNF